MASTQRFERFSTIFLVAGLGSLIVAFLILGLVPATMVNKGAATAGLPNTIPAESAAYYKDLAAYQAGLLKGRDIYIAEACWHCHSQYVRPVSNEALRYGPVSQPGEYQSALHLPQLFGTRRVGPDLSREAGKRTHDWHFAHLYDPKSVVPQSVMPTYPWLFEEIVDETGKKTIKPTQEAIDLVSYLDSLGHSVRGHNRGDYGSGIVMPPKK